MLTVSLFVEFLRTRPRLFFWLVALTQAALWVLVPTLFYAGPPADLAEMLAAAHRLKVDPDFSPPLAYWLAEIVFRLARQHLFGIYLLSQICVVVTYWAVFRLGQAIVGDRHAVIAVLLMIGVSALSVPTPEFGPAILAMPLWALALLHYWRAVGEERRLYWYALAIDLGLLLLTTYAGFVLFALLAVFTVATERGRTNAKAAEAGVAYLVFVMLLAPHQFWFDDSMLPHLRALWSWDALAQSPAIWARLVAALFLAHAGLAVLVGLATNLFRPKPVEAPIIRREQTDPFGRIFVYVFALAPPVAVIFFSGLAGQSKPILIAPLVILFGLAVVIAGGDAIRFDNQRATAMTWSGLLLALPVLAVAAAILLPAIFAVPLRVAQPATQIGGFFTENFERRTGKPLEVVAGDFHLASLVGLASPRRPIVFRETTGGRTPGLSHDELLRKGAIVVWTATDTQGTPPADIKARFPEIVAELPRAFEQRLQGRLPLMRIGWGVIRPQEPPAPAPAAKTQ